MQPQALSLCGRTECLGDWRRQGPLGSTGEERVGRKVLRSSSEASNWSDDFGNLGAESQEGRGENRQTEEQAGGWTGGRIQGCGMKLLPSWRAVLPVGARGRFWLWTQQTRSRWALGGWAWAAVWGAEPQPLDPPSPWTQLQAPWPDWAGPSRRQRQAGPRAGFRGCVTCSHTGPGTWKGSRRCLMFCCYCLENS